MLGWLLVFGFASTALNGQRVSLLNPGFEDIPAISMTPRAWADCGFQGESPPDIFPGVGFNVVQQPFSGRSFVGLVTRDNNTWERMGAGLSAPLQRGQCYDFTIYLARSERYTSRGRSSGMVVDYNRPVRLRLWGGTRPCELGELLAESPLIEHADWRPYTFRLRPEQGSYEHLVLEVFYEDVLREPYNGNLLLDAASAFNPVEDCDPAAAESEPGEEPVILSPPEPRFWQNEEDMRFFLANVLRDLYLDEALELRPKQFQLEGETSLRDAHPACYALAEILRHRPDERWLLVVNLPDSAVQELLVLEISRQMAKLNLTNLTVRGYEADRDDGREWFCMSTMTGLYLARE